MPHSAFYASPIGKMLAQSEDGLSLARLAFCDGDDGAEELRKGCNSSIPLFENVARWLDIYFSGAAPPFTPPLSFRRGTDFQKAVWEEAMHIPFGQTATYGEIARRLSEKKKRAVSARAVGAALARNPIALIAPCHRVLGATGELKGFRWGAARKKALLLHEAGHSAFQ